MVQNDSNPLILDGSQGEGGGSILRVAAGLACVRNRPLRVINIRRNRSNPGLRPQHLIGIQALKTLTNGTLSDVRVGTEELNLHPGSDWRTALDLTIPTAGNVGLLMQTLHNALYRAPIEKCSIQIHGGGTYGMDGPGDVLSAKRYLCIIQPPWLFGRPERDPPRILSKRGRRSRGDHYA